ncbi:hypothetical protein ACJZ2D_000985 [Fusarium nematophilum]
MLEQLLITGGHLPGIISLLSKQPGLLYLQASGQLQYLLIELHIRPALAFYTYREPPRDNESDQVPNIKSLTSHQRNLNDLAHSLEDVKDVSQAKSILEEVNPDAVIWSTGAGGKGGPDRTFAIDRDAAINFIKATVQTSSISKFSLISYLACRRKSPTCGFLSYCQAKLAADEVLLQEASRRADFSGISLRPEAIVSLLEHENVKTSWLDMLDGAEGIESSIERIVSARDDAAEGEVS